MVTIQGLKVQKATLKNIGSSFLTDMQQVRKGEPLVVGSKGAESSKVKAERIETEKIKRLEGKKLRRLVRLSGPLTADKKMGDMLI